MTKTKEEILKIRETRRQEMTKTKEQEFELDYCPICIQATNHGCCKCAYKSGKAETLKEFKKFLIECEGEIIGKCFIKNGFSKWAKLQEVKII